MKNSFSLLDSVGIHMPELKPRPMLSLEPKLLAVLQTRLTCCFFVITAYCLVFVIMEEMLFIYFDFFSFVVQDMNHPAQII